MMEINAAGVAIVIATAVQYVFLVARLTGGPHTWTRLHGGLDFAIGTICAGAAIFIFAQPAPMAFMVGTAWGIVAVIRFGTGMACVLRDPRV